MKKVTLVTVAMLTCPGFALGATISSPLDPALAFAKIEDFSGTAIDNTTRGTPRVFEDFTLTHAGSNGARVQNHTVLDGATGTYLVLSNRQSVSTITFDFTLSAVGFQFDAADLNWLIQALDNSGSVLGEHLVLGAQPGGIYPSRYDQYVGFAAAGIRSLTFSFSQSYFSGFQDAVIIDDIAYVASSELATVPVPASGLLLTAALFGVAGWRWQRHRRQVETS